MKFQYVRGFNLCDAWKQLLKLCLEEGYRRPVYRGAEKWAYRLELDMVAVEVERPDHEWWIWDVPEGVPPPATHESILEYYARYIRTADIMAEVQVGQEGWDYIYGHRIGAPILKAIEEQPLDEPISPIEAVMRILAETPESNRGVLEIGRPEDIELRHFPCWRYAQFKVRYGKLHGFVVFRSWDLYAGMPVNLGGITLLMIEMTDYIRKHNPEMKDLAVGKLFAFSMGLHLYERQVKFAEMIVNPPGKSRRFLATS